MLPQIGDGRFLELDDELDVTVLVGAVDISPFLFLDRFLDLDVLFLVAECF